MADGFKPVGRYADKSQNFMKRYRHLFFDLDHTLWDFESNSRLVLQELYKNFDLKNEGIPNVNSLILQFEQQNERFWVRYRKGQISREDLRWKRFWHLLWQFDIRDYPLATALSDSYLKLLPKQRGLMPGTKEILTYCQQKKCHLHIITNGFETAQHQKLHQSGIHHFFREIITAQSSGYLKPCKEIFDFALKKAKAHLSESLMIGDAAEADIIGAQGIGLDQVFFNVRKTEHQLSPTYEIFELLQLKEIL